MKKSFLTMMAIAIFSTTHTMSAQVKIGNDGFMMLGNGTSATPLSPLSIGTNGSSLYKMRILTDSLNRNGLYIDHQNNSNKVASGLVLRSAGSNSSSYSYAARILSTARASGQNIGLYSLMNNGSAYTRIGVAGCLSSSSGTCVGIYGGKSSTPVIGYPGCYAGYFYGDVLSTGSVYGTSFLTSYPSVLGTLSPLETVSTTGTTDSDSLVDRLASLSLISYRVTCDVAESESVSDLADDIFCDGSSSCEIASETTSTPSETATAASGRQSTSDTRYALELSQLKAVFPEFVYEDSEGNASVDYVGMIPLLVQSIGKLQARIAELENAISDTDSYGLVAEELPEQVETTAQSGIAQASSDKTAALRQNSPNPFDTNTSIKVTVPETAADAALVIFDINGKTLKEISISARGDSTISIRSSDLCKGMFLYSLVIDGNVIETRKMIIR